MVKEKAKKVAKKVVAKETKTVKAKAVKKVVVKAETKAAPKKETPKKTVAKKEVISEELEVQGNESVELEAGKQEIINKFSTHSADTGSPEVQVAILTFKIVKLQEHLQKNPKDNHSRRGLLKIVSKRRRIMKYLRDKDEKRYNTLEAKIQEYQKAD